MEKVLLHICCGVCALASLERLKAEGFYVAAFFFNPNIHPRAEYLKRRDAARIAARAKAVTLYEGRYQPGQWQSICGRHCREKEGGERCRLCYELRLKATYRLCVKKQYDYYSTALTISPLKSSALILESGKKIGGSKFLFYDFKKQDGFKASIAQAKTLNLYRQNYCGCVYSRRAE